MRRYALDTIREATSGGQYDVIIAGGGLAGLYAALQLDENLSCAVLVKDTLFGCNSSLAQGGIAAVTHPGDDVGRHISDTLKAGGPPANRQAVEMMVREGPAEIHALASMGVAFDADDGGRWVVTQEGGHTKKRVLHCGGDATGDHMIRVLSSLVLSKKNIRVLENSFLADILTSGSGSVAGVVVLRDTPEILHAPRVVIASGGIGQVYLHTTNQQGITGDGIAAALRAGATCKHMEFIQFHPTAFYDVQNNSTGFLISEAVRGERGVLRNHDGIAFMEAYHPMKDLAPRDVVARAIWNEMASSGTSHVYLDCTSRSGSFLAKRFPTIFRHCEQAGISMHRDPIPVAPVQHYSMGGIQVTCDGQSSAEGLYACGEAACTGAHGANRLASNSLLECLVFSRQCARHINDNPVLHPGTAALPRTPSRQIATRVDWDGYRQQIRELLQEHGGIVRNGEGLRKALDGVQRIIASLEEAPMTNPLHTETFNMAMVAREIISAALDRRENVGAHYRTDNPPNTPNT